MGSIVVLVETFLTIFKIWISSIVPKFLRFHKSPNSQIHWLSTQKCNWESWEFFLYTLTHFLFSLERCLNHALTSFSTHFFYLAQTSKWAKVIVAIVILLHVIYIHIIFLWSKMWCIYSNGFYVCVECFCPILVQFIDCFLNLVVVLKMNKEKLEIFIRKDILPFQENSKLF
jgi:hypothetical protein